MKYPITPEYLQNVPDGLVKLYLDLEADIINSICDRLNTGQANATALELIRELQRRGMPLKDIEKRIRKTLNISQKTLTSILEDAAMRNNTYYGTAYDALGIVQETAQIDAMAEEVEAITRQTQQQLQNITRSMGFGVRGMDGNITVSNIQDTYQKILDRAELKVLSSDCSYNVAIRDGVRDMANSGLIGDWIEYNDEDGNVYHRNRVDVAVRRAVMTGVTQISGRYAEIAAEDMETDLYEVTAHSGARDKGTGWQNHKAWQGKVYRHKGRGQVSEHIRGFAGLEKLTGLRV
jgi:Phage minor capsid protein 2.